MQKKNETPHDNKARDELKEIRQLILKSVNSQMVDLDTLAANIDTYTQSRVLEVDKQTEINGWHRLIQVLKIIVDAEKHIDVSGRNSHEVAKHWLEKSKEQLETITDNQERRA